MEVLKSYQEKIIQQVDDHFFRSLFQPIPWGQRMIAIKGLRGAGKTTMMLQYLQYALKSDLKALYVSADNPWFYNHTLLETAEEHVKMGGKVLFIDEVHKYPRWSIELKNIYDIFAELNVIFSASSALDIYHGEADLSRRVLTFELPGLSFREYLQLLFGQEFPTVTLPGLIENHQEMARAINERIRPLPTFKSYLKSGYLPMIKETQEDMYLPRLANIITAVLENDLSYIEEYSAANLIKVKKLLGVIAESVPFEPNISAMARKMYLGRDTVNNYLRHLQNGKVLNLVQKHTKGVAALQKPDKIFFENPNFLYALKATPDAGTLRETFLLNQLNNAGHRVTLPAKGDFYIASEDLVIEVGGKNKERNQIKNVPNALIAADDVEYGFQRKIPLWLFGFLY